MPDIVLNTSLRGGMYIRQECWDLYHIIEQQLTSDESIRRVLVLGSSGIGKSALGVFLVLVFMMEKKDIAYRSLGGRRICYFSWNTEKGYLISETPLAGRSYKGLFDGNDAGALGCDPFFPAHVFASPSNENYHYFEKEACFKVYMNPWTKAECQGFADAVNDEWLRKFNLVGGKPRLVFSSSESFDDLVHRVNADIPPNIDGLKSMVRLFEQKLFGDRTKHTVFHMYRNELMSSFLI